MAGKKRVLIRAIFLGWMMFSAGPTWAAQPGPDLVMRARKGLSDYSDIDRALAMVRTLTEAVTRPPDPLLAHDPAKDPELAFLRMAATTDLLFLARMSGDPARVTAVAQAYGVPVEQLEKSLVEALAHVAQGPFRMAAPHVGPTLALALAKGPDLSDLSRMTGVARDASLLHALADAQGKGALRAALSILGASAPRTGDVTELGLLDESSRGVALGLERAAQAVAQVHAAASSGNPLASALESTLTEALGVLGAGPVGLSYRLPQGTVRAAEGSLLPGEMTTAALIATKSGTALLRGAYGRLNQQGKLETASAEGDFSPRYSGLALPVLEEGQLERVTLSTLCEGAEHVTLGVAPAADLDARELGQAMLFVLRAGCTDVQLLSLDQRGETSHLPLEVQVGRDSGESPRSVRVRLGGYTVKVSGKTFDVPRVREESGGFRFDSLALSAALAGDPGRVAVSYMPDVSAAELTTALHVASGSARQPALLVVP